MWWAWETDKSWRNALKKELFTPPSRGRLSFFHALPIHFSSKEADDDQPRPRRWLNPFLAYLAIAPPAPKSRSSGCGGDTSTRFLSLIGFIRYKIFGSGIGEWISAALLKILISLHDLVGQSSRQGSTNNRARADKALRRITGIWWPDWTTLFERIVIHQEIRADPKWKCVNKVVALVGAPYPAIDLPCLFRSRISFKSFSLERHLFSALTLWKIRFAKPAVCSRRTSSFTEHQAG